MKIRYLSIFLLSLATLFFIQRLDAAADLQQEAFEVLSRSVRLKEGAVLTQDNFPGAMQQLRDFLKQRYDLPEVSLAKIDWSQPLQDHKVSSLSQKGSDCGLYACFNMGLFMQEARGEAIKNTQTDLQQFMRAYQVWLTTPAGQAANITQGDAAVNFVSSQVVSGLFLHLNGEANAKKVQIAEFVFDEYTDSRYQGIRENLFLNQLSATIQDRIIGRKKVSDAEAQQKEEALCLRLKSLFDPEPGLFDERQCIKDWYQFFAFPDRAEPIYCILTNAGHFNAMKFYLVRAQGKYQVHVDIRDSAGYSTGNANFIFSVMSRLFRTGQLKKYYDAACDNPFMIEYSADQSFTEYLNNLLENIDSVNEDPFIDTLYDLCLRAEEFGFWQKPIVDRTFYIHFKKSGGAFASKNWISLTFLDQGQAPLFLTDKEDTPVPDQSTDAYWAQNYKSWANYVKEDLLAPLYERVAQKVSSKREEVW